MVLRFKDLIVLVNAPQHSSSEIELFDLNLVCDYVRYVCTFDNC